MKRAVKISDNVISPLGTSTVENLDAILRGESALRVHSGSEKDIPEDFCASLIDEESLSGEYLNAGIPLEEYTPFERRLILSISKALSGTGIDPSSRRVLFVISSTKANVELLHSENPSGKEYPGYSAVKVASFFGNGNAPLTVSNACISGLSAQITAVRELECGHFDTAIVAGADIQSRFIISGFQSFKALSPNPCRPFDSSRDGLNPGEAAATVIYTWKEPQEGEWYAERGAVRNDANHISGPSRTGEGSYRALKAVMDDPEELAMVNVHGKATVYNDEMESIALSRAGLSAVPVNGYKGYYGHTMGAAGIMETALSMASLDKGVIVGMKGYSECGVSCALNISNENRPASGKAFIKLLSGFGGCNAAMLFRKKGGAL